jgi:hypothetical protein
VANPHPLVDNHSITYPHAIFEDDWLARGVPGLVFDAMKVTVHDHDVAANQTVVANLHVIRGYEGRAVIYRNVVSDLEVSAW